MDSWTARRVRDSMAERRGPRKASPWPVFVAIGLAVSEVGVFLDLVPLAVGGLLLFAGSCAGGLEDAGYARTPWRLLGALGVVLAIVGTGLWYAYPTEGEGIALGFRGMSIAVAGAFCVGAAVVGSLHGRLFGA